MAMALAGGKMKVLVINAGSSSFKYQLIDMDKEQVLCSGLVERIGDPMGAMTHKILTGGKEKKISIERPFNNHVEGMKAVVDEIIHPEHGVIKSKKEIDAIGHRVVMGGEALQQSVIIDDKVKQAIRDNFPLSPLHNPANLAGIEVAEEIFPGVPNVAVFDTEFHSSMPEAAYLYPLPYDLYKNYGIRRYGFHGTSHRYVMEKAAEFLKRSLNQFNAITCHLGNGCSISAIKHGKCIDTSMGTTPLDGLMMGTRCGSIDPAIINILVEKTGKTVKEIDTIMNKQSGLKGICGLNDMRDIHKACSEGNKQAQLALDMFAYRIKKCIGSYMAIIGKLDAIIFTAGIGENDAITRGKVCEGMEHMGIVLDKKLNDTRNSKPHHINAEGAPINILVIPTNEELAIAKTTERLTKTHH